MRMRIGYKHGTLWKENYWMNPLSSGKVEKCAINRCGQIHKKYEIRWVAMYRTNKIPYASILVTPIAKTHRPSAGGGTYGSLLVSPPLSSMGIFPANRNFLRWRANIICTLVFLVDVNRLRGGAGRFIRWGITSIQRISPNLSHLGERENPPNKRAHFRIMAAV